MKKIAFLFPGQGAQYVGMATDFIDRNPEFKKVLASFDEKNHTDLFSIMKSGPEEKLKETKFTQPAILFHSIIAMKSLLSEIEINPSFVAGHSLGEFSALVANGVISFADALYLVHKRGEFMIAANEGKPFAMSAVIGPDAETINQICRQASSEGVVIPANFNTPGQTVISGSKAGVEKANELFKEFGAKRVVPLAVGGPFHSPLIKKAETWLAEEMENINFRETEIPVISNVNALPVVAAEMIKDNLAKQVTSSVLWVDSMNFLINEGVELFIEFGPKKVLAGMLKRIDRKAKILSIDTVEDLEKVVSELK